MEFYLLCIIGLLICFIIKEKKLNKSLVEQNEKLKQNNKKTNEKLDDVKKELLEKQKTIKKLNEEIKNLSDELKIYTEIKKDSLGLNVIDDNEKQDIQEKIIENKENDLKTNYIDKEELNKEKQEIYSLMENTNMNLFITGKAGTGKSYLLKYFRKKTKKNVLYCAPTGIAALNIEGVTLHSAFGWNNLKEDADILLSSNKISLLKRLDTLIIDEISMVRVDIFNQIDKILKTANNSSEPFGGKQVILLGDLFQLPPVAKKEETEYFNDKYGGVFFFHSPAYKNGNFEFKELEEVFRQTEQEFIEILNDIRVGNINEDHIESLNKHFVKEVPRRVVQVVPMKSEANVINTTNLDLLKGQQYEYKANILIGEDKIKETDFPCDFDLKLKVGALVMMVTNDQEYKRWVNGTLGIVSELSPTMIKVTINGTDFEISPTPFNKNKCVYDKEKGKLEYRVEASVNQFPLILAYAITIHKSQGMTYQQIACDLDNCFAPGQAYVALSRCANYDKLYLTKKVKASSIITDNVVAEFYRKIKKEN